VGSRQGLLLTCSYLAEKEAFRRVGAAEREKENKGK
jgi:hypothetical protein